MENNTIRVFADRLEDLISISGKSLNLISREAGIAIGSLSAYQNAKQVAGVDKLKILADYFGVSCDYLLGNDKNKNAKNEAIYKANGVADEAIDSLLKLKQDIDRLVANLNKTLDRVNG